MAGAGYKLFNTGDVLTAAQVNTYLQEQVVMVFNDATARTTALSGVLAEGMVSYLKDTDAVQYYNGSSWTTINTDQTPLTTKGDLFTYSTTDARLPVGNNGETLVADSSASVGLRYQEPKAGNPIINSAFQVWQRGTSFTADAYSADRWYFYRGTTGKTLSRQTTGDTINLPNIQYCARVQRDSGNTSTSAIVLINNLETADSIPFVGKTVTLSFYARAGANFSSTSNLMKGYIVSGTGTDQNQVSGFTGQAVPITVNATLTTTWQRFSGTGTISSSATQIAVRFDNTPVGTAGAADFFEVTGVQVEVGSVATPFKTYAATLAGELAACQRYYYRHVSDGTVFSLAYGNARSTSQIDAIMPFPVTMRSAPNAIDYTTLGTVPTYADGITSVSTLVINQCSKNAALLLATSSGTPFTKGTGYYLLANNSTTAYIGLSAEL